MSAPFLLLSLCRSASVSSAAVPSNTMFVCALSLFISCRVGTLSTAHADDHVRASCLCVSPFIACVCDNDDHDHDDAVADTPVRTLRKTTPGGDVIIAVNVDRTRLSTRIDLLSMSAASK